MEKRKIRVKPSKKQYEALMILLEDNGVSFLWYGGAVGGWKTILAGMWLSMMCKKYPLVRYWVFRRYITDALDTTFQSFTKALSILWLVEAHSYDSMMKDPGAFDYVVRNGGKEITFSNWSEIWFRWLQDKPTDVHFTKVGGLELTGCYVDEANECPEIGISVLKKRVWRHMNAEYKIPRKMLCTFNPDKWWVYRTFWQPFKDWTQKDWVQFIRALPTDNPYLTEEYLHELRTERNEVLKQRLLYGNFDYDDTPGRLFEYNAILNLWNNPAINWDKYVSIDVARKGKDSTIIFEWDWLEVKAIKSEKISQLLDLSESIRKDYQWKVSAKNMIVDENWVWWWLIDNLRCQWFINNAKPLEPKNSNLSKKRNYEHLKAQCYFKLAEYVNLWKIRISVDDKEIRDKLIEELDIVVELNLDKDWKIKIIKKEDIIMKLWRSPDYSDAMMMRMFYELDKRSPIVEIQEKENEDDPLGLFEEDETSEIEIEYNPY